MSILTLNLYWYEDLLSSRETVVKLQNSIFANLGSKPISMQRPRTLSSPRTCTSYTEYSYRSTTHINLCCTVSRLHALECDASPSIKLVLGFETCSDLIRGIFHDFLLYFVSSMRCNAKMVTLTIYRRKKRSSLFICSAAWIHDLHVDAWRSSLVSGDPHNRYTLGAWPFVTLHSV